MISPFLCLLFDNGSLRAESTLSLRRLAGRLGQRLGYEVEAVSLLHSGKVPSVELGGVPAKLLEPTLKRWGASHPKGRVLLLPLFFGPSGALEDYVPARLSVLRANQPGLVVVQAAPLVVAEEEPWELVRALADRVRTRAAEQGWHRPKVVLCDHGSPQPAVTAVRDRLGLGLRRELGDEAEWVAVASMERREGEAYAFNDPLLAALLASDPFREGEVVVALQFLSPGRHAGPGGDVAEICRAAEARATERGGALKTAMTETLAGDDRLLDVLVRRAQAGRARLDALSGDGG